MSNKEFENTKIIDVDKTLYNAVYSAGQKFGGNAALLYMGKTITYNTFLQQTSTLATAMSNIGIVKGDVVTVCLPNIPQSIYAFYAISKLGAVAHLVHPMTKPQQMREYLKDITSKAIFILQGFLDDYPVLGESLDIPIISVSPAHSLGAIKRTAYNALNRTQKTFGSHIRFVDFIKKYGRSTIQNCNACGCDNDNNCDSTACNCENDNNCDSTACNCEKEQTEKNTACNCEKDNACECDNNDYRGVTIDAHKTAVLLHSGGTSGAPKAIELSARAINCLAAKGPFILGTDDVSGKYMLSVLPMFHGFGMCMGVHAMLCHGGCNAIMPKFDKNECIRLLSKNKITYMIGVPILYEALLAHPKFCGDKLKGIDIAFVGGDFVAKNLMTKFDKRMKESGSEGRLFEGYGLTETVTVASVNTKKYNREGSVGRALPNLDIEVFSDGKKQARGVSGELYISGDTLMNRYYKNEVATTEEFYEYEGKIWAKTGDFGYVDNDGYVFFKNRLKRIIKVSGINVFPSEIENLIMEQDEVLNVCALEVSDAGRGSMIKLFVAAHNFEHLDIKSLTVKYSDLIEAKLGKYARPQRIVFLPRLPLTSVGKVDSEKLKTVE